MTIGIQRRLACVLIVTAALALSAMSGCSDGGGGSSAENGTLQVLMTDAATDQYNVVYVTVDRVEVNRGEGEEGWIVVGTPGKTSNLLDLVNGVTQELGLADLAPGHYAQLRLILGSVPDNGTNIDGQSHPYANYLILPNGSARELTVPSGLQTGIKVTGGFDMTAGELTTLLLDFDASRSVVQAGSSAQWLLKPTITLHTANVSAPIQGTVSGDGAALSGARVSAQIIKGAEVAPVVAAATVSGENGGYIMDVAPGDYTVVAVRTGYRSACGQASVTAGGAALDLALSPVPTGSVSGKVSIADAPAEATVTISVRGGLNCGGDDLTLVEIVSLQVLNNSDYSIVLPIGAFSLVYASEKNYGSDTVVIQGDMDQVLNIEL